MKRILILYAKYGGGHLSAAKAIENYLEENYLDVNIRCVDCVEYVNVLLSNVTTGAYKQMAKRAPWAWKKVYDNSQKGVLSKFSSFANKKMAKKLHDLYKEFLPDVVISTHPFATQMISYLKEHEHIDCKLATILTDFAPHDQWLVGKDFGDLFFVSNDSMKKELIEKYSVPSEKVHVTGVPLSDRFLDKFDEPSIYKQFNLNENKKTILFFGGGEFGLGKKRTVSILRSLVTHLDDYQIVAISGKNKKMNDEFLKLDKELKNNDLHIYKYTTNVPELMHISSLVVTKPGGLTSSESLASELPILIINPIPGQEEQNAEFLEQSGAGVWLKKEDNIDEVINSLLLHPEKLEEMKKCCSLLAHKNSTKNICDTIINN